MSEKTAQMIYRVMVYRAKLHAENDRLRAQRDLLLDALKQSLEEAIYPSKRLSDVYEKACTAVKAVEGE